MKTIIWIALFLARCSEFIVAYKVSPVPHPYVYNVLAGSRNPQWEDINFLRPSLASLWPLKKSTFQVVVWPLDSCQTVVICTVPKESYSDDVNIHIKSCENRIIYYPQKKQLIHSKTVYSFQRSTIDFRLVNEKSHQLRVQQQSYYHRKDFKKDGGKLIDFSFDNKDILIYSDSFACQAHVFQAGPSSFYDLSRSDAFLPSEGIKTYEYLVDGRAGSKVVSYVEMKPAGARKVDFLPVLKAIKFDKVSQGYCTSFSRNTRYTPTGDEKVISHSFNVEKNTITVKDSRDMQILTVRLSTCKWVRIWIHESADMSQYASSFNPKDSIDIFFDKGFLLTPDSDEAVQMAGDEIVAETIQLKVHKNNVVEVAYGPTSTAYSYSHYFNWPTMHKPTFKVHLIKSPQCDAQIFQAEKVIRHNGNTRSENLFNRFELGPCSYNAQQN